LNSPRVALAIVNRIPDDYLAPEQRETIAKGLLTRRDLVRVGGKIHVADTVRGLLILEEI
jgi:hypothetical protein